MITVLWYFSQLARHLGYTKGNTLAARIKASLSILLYTKISSLTTYIIKSSQLGKITNLLASDLGVFELRLSNFLALFSYPIYAIGTTTLLVTRLGWPGVVGIIVVMLGVPVSNFISKQNGNFISDINIYKDRRIQQVAELIDGIKFVKLYGWEVAFRRII